MIRTSEAVLVRLDGETWVSLSDAREVYKPARGRPALEDLLRIPAPSVIPGAAFPSLRRPGMAENGSVAADLDDPFTRQLLRERWFRLGDVRQWTEPRGSVVIELDRQGRFAGLDFEVRGKILPEDGRGVPRKRPRNPNPRVAGKYKLPVGVSGVRLRFSNYDAAVLPVDEGTLRRLGLSGQ
jgi:hypothetical protein